MKASVKEWVAVGLALAIATSLALYRGNAFAVGDSTTIAFSFVPEDKAALACAMPVRGELGCAFREDGATLTRVNRAVIPAVSTTGGLALVRGAFDGAVAEQMLTTHRRKNTRFTLNCDARLLGTVSQVQVRFSPRSPWTPEKELKIWDLSGCR